MSLESLPPELLTIILKSHDSLLDLHNLISASPACLRVLSSASKHILPVVIRKGIPAHDLTSLNEHLERQAHVTQLLNLPSDEYIDQFVVDYSYSYTKYEMYEYTSLISYPHVMRNQIERYKLYMRLYNLIQVYSTCLNSLGLDATTFTCTPPKLTSLQEAFLPMAFPQTVWLRGQSILQRRLFQMIAILNSVFGIGICPVLRLGKSRSWFVWSYMLLSSNKGIRVGK